MGDRKLAKERNYDVAQAQKSEREWDGAKETLNRLKKKSEGGHSSYEE
jgi:hypothetical protein